MKVKINENSIDFNALMSDLEERFGDTYKVKKFGKNKITLAKGKITGAVVTLAKNKLIVVGTFPNPFIYAVFVFIMVFTGILIPMVLYLIFFHKKMQQCGKEVGSYVLENYVNPQLAYQKS